MQHHTVDVPIELAGKRLDTALAQLFPDYSRSRIKAWIEQGQVLVNGKSMRPAIKLVGGESIELNATIDAPRKVAAQAIPLDVIYDDEHIVVVNKPAGLVVHPGAGNPDRTMQNALLHAYPDLEPLPRSGIIHRLDKDTTGLLVVARSIAAHTHLVRAMEARQIGREYQAVCVGVMTAGGTINQPIARHPVDRLRMAVRHNGKPAITHYRVMERYRGHTRVRVTLETGRTHQIRVHMAYMKQPLVGDPVYGGRLKIPAGASDALATCLRAFKRQALHAQRLSLSHPVSGEAMEWRAPLPEDYKQLVASLQEDLAHDE